MSTASSTPRFGRPGGAARTIPVDDGTSDAATMTDRTDTTEQTESTGRSVGRVRRLLTKAPPELGVLLVIAAVLNLYGLGINGNANEYYSAAVHSMTQSWSAFFFGTFDPAGLMTVDKPPLALWIQTISVKAFGFNSWAFLVPQALMGIAAVALTFDLTRRRFGRAAAFVAGLALATTPTAVAVFRHNNPDALLMLCSTLALWATVRAFESPHRTRWLVLAGVAVGLGFEAKMATALLVVPAIVAAWLWVRPLGMLRSIRQLAAFSASAAAVGLAWPIAVWLVPASDRPWISGTNDNSIWSLIFGYNGLGRLVGQSGGPGGNTGGGPGGGGGGMGRVFGGDAGPLRLLDSSLGSQGGWLLGLAIGGGLAILAASRLRRGDARTGWLIAIAGTFATTAVAFSFASGIFHPYYVSALAPFTAALAGGGLATMVGRRALGRYGVPSSDRVVDAGVGGAATARDASSSNAATTSAPQLDPAGRRSSPIAAGRGTGGATAVPALLWRDGDTGAGADLAGDGDSTVRDSVTASSDDAHEPTAAYTSAVNGPATVPAAGDAADEPTVLVRIIGGGALVAGAVTSGVVLGDADQFGLLSPVLLAATIVAGIALIAVSSRKVRIAAVGAAAGLLLVAPAVWSAQTLGHATQGTFPTGGPETAAGMGGPGGRGAMGGRRGGFGGQPGMRQGGTHGFTPPTGAGAQGFTPPTGAGTQGFTPPTGAGAQGGPGGFAPPSSSATQAGSGATGTTGTTQRGFGRGGGMFSGNQTGVNEALTYAKANGGGTIVVSGQSGAAPTILSSGATVAGIGGFSGSESEVSLDWFADRVASGEIRWVITSGGGMGGRDSRTGSRTVMNAVASTCTAVPSVDGLYDCQGMDNALRSAAATS